MAVPKVLKLRVTWSKAENDFMISYPRKADGHFMHQVLGKKIILCLTTSVHEDEIKAKIYDKVSSHKDNPNMTFFNYDWIKDLEKRGYDLSTLKFEITIKKEHLKDRFDHVWDELTEKEKEDVIKLGFVPPSKE